jgi:hypothetical protein
MIVLVAGCGADGRGSVPEQDEGSPAKDVLESSSDLEPQERVEVASAGGGRWFGAEEETSGGSGPD